MSFANRLRAVIKEERLSQAKFAAEIGISRPAVEKYLSETTDPAGWVMLKITNHATFKKYALWLMTGDTAPESGQVCPDFSIQEQCGLVDEESRKQA
ncbi:helix-turn-helix transcriptional regulator [Enterovibrio nigricans]|uniref:HTH cro/C1-type domain-containing protein n=1 Tax=Enterovibrio nigricans DSM 22720 TaxID=1121868 RepID=A0A1T4VZ77_9GAMM|nr:helix-turn-helix transcriptional regulator [Enterovibrio nigricans]PKF49162.1 XRE family transcriptional regulator [Enterovibrio nigricans]SKA70237.1 hypothetical protein SAMN02745132_04557 [Enterovibrio nigricans DSM 22720]